MSGLEADYLFRCQDWSDIQDHLPRLYDEACRPGVKVIELGVRTGNSTAAFLAAAEAHDGHVWSVDITNPHAPRMWTESGRWTLHVGDDLDPAIVAALPDQVDIVFIDTSHLYAQTLAELRLYAPKVKPGGVVLLHDTELEAPHGATADDPPFPVAVALRKHAEANGMTVEWVSGCNGLGVLYIPGGAR